MNEDIKSNVKNIIKNDDYNPSRIRIPEDEEVGSLVCTKCSNIKVEYILCNNSGIVEECIEDCKSKTLHKFISHEQIRE